MSDKPGKLTDDNSWYRVDARFDHNDRPENWRLIGEVGLSKDTGKLVDIAWKEGAVAVRIYQCWRD